MEQQGNPPDRTLVNFGPALQKKKDETSDHLTKVYDKMIDDYIQSAGLESNQPPNLLIPPHLRLAKLRQEIKNEIESVELKEYLKIAFQSLINDGENFVDSEEYGRMCDQFSESSDYLNEIDFNKSNEENFQKLLHIDDTSMETVLKIAKGEFRDNKFEESLSIFALLHFLVPEDPEYSYRLGIVARRTHKIELALRAFSNAASLDPEFFQPRLYAAESHLKLGHFQEAAVEIDEAKKILDLTTMDPIWSDWIVELEKGVKDQQR
jgi:tetratricopeptide (TPR) repeat protein